MSANDYQPSIRLAGGLQKQKGPAAHVSKRSHRTWEISAIEPSNDDRCKQRACFVYYDMGLNKVKICFCVESKVRRKLVYEIPQSFYPACEMKSVVKLDRATEEMADKNYQVQR